MRSPLQLQILIKSEESLKSGKFEFRQFDLNLLFPLLFFEFGDKEIGVENEIQASGKF